MIVFVFGACVYNHLSLRLFPYFLMLILWLFKRHHGRVSYLTNFVYFGWMRKEDALGHAREMLLESVFTFYAILLLLGLELLSRLGCMGNQQLQFLRICYSFNLVAHL